MFEPDFLFLACKGPGAMIAIQESTRIGYYCVAFAVVGTLLLIRDRLVGQKPSFVLPVALVLVLLHPAWTISARRGDCGELRVLASYVFTGVLISLLIHHYRSKKCRVG